MQNKFRFFVAMALGLVVFASAAPTSAQLPQPLWSVTYGRIHYGYGYFHNEWIDGINVLSDGGFVASVRTERIYPNDPYGSDSAGMLLRFDKFGKLTNNFSFYHFGGALAPAGNDEFLITGVIRGNSPIGLLAKVNSAGNAIWAKSVNTSIPNFWGSVNISAISPTSDGNFAALVYQQRYPGYPKDPNDRNIFLKIDGNGEIVAQQNYSLTLYYPSIASLPDGGIFAASDSLAARFDNMGTMQWQKRYSLPLSDYSTFEASISLPQEGFIAAGSVYNHDFSRDGFILKLDGNGEIVWGKKIAFARNNYVKSLALADDGFLAAGISLAATNIPTVTLYIPWIIKLDPQGNLIWAKDYGSYASSSKYLMPIYINPASDSSFILGSARITTTYDDNDVWLAKIDSNGDIGASCVVTSLQPLITAITPTVSNFGSTIPLTGTLVYTNAGVLLDYTIPFEKTSECRSGLACQLFLPAALRGGDSSW